MKGQIDIDVRLDAGTFRRYCFFDAFVRRRRWYWPALISAVLITAALAGLLGWVGMSDSLSGLLMGLGIAVPMVNLGLYCVTIEAQVARQGLKAAPPVYALRLDREGVRITNRQKQEPPVELSWDRVWAAFRRRNDVYLYVNPERALILPDGQASVACDALWAFLLERLGDGRCLVSGAARGKK